MCEHLKDRLMKELLNTLEEKVHLVRGANTVYSDASLFITLVWAGINKISLERVRSSCGNWATMFRRGIRCCIICPISPIIS